MVQARVVETNGGIQGKFTVEIYDRMQRRFRDKGWTETKAVIRSGIAWGMALKVGPGFLGPEWGMERAWKTGSVGACVIRRIVIIYV